MSFYECIDIQKSIDGYLDGELAGSGLDAFTRHLEECGGCKKALALAKSIREACGGISGELAAPPAGFHEELMSRIRAESGQTAPGAMRRGAAEPAAMETGTAKRGFAVRSAAEQSSEENGDAAGRHAGGPVSIAGRRAGSPAPMAARPARKSIFPPMRFAMPLRIAAVLLICVSVAFAASVLTRIYLDGADSTGAADMAAAQTTHATTRATEAGGAGASVALNEAVEAETVDEEIEIKGDAIVAETTVAAAKAADTTAAANAGAARATAAAAQTAGAEKAAPDAATPNAAAADAAESAKDIESAVLSGTGASEAEIKSAAEDDSAAIDNIASAAGTAGAPAPAAVPPPTAAGGSAGKTENASNGGDAVKEAADAKISEAGLSGDIGKTGASGEPADVENARELAGPDTGAGLSSGALIPEQDALMSVLDSGMSDIAPLTDSPDAAPGQGPAPKPDAAPEQGSTSKPDAATGAAPGTGSAFKPDATPKPDTASGATGAPQAGGGMLAPEKAAPPSETDKPMSESDKPQSVADSPSSAGGAPPSASEAPALSGDDVAPPSQNNAPTSAGESVQSAQNAASSSAGDGYEYMFSAPKSEAEANSTAIRSLTRKYSGDFIRLSYNENRIVWRVRLKRADLDNFVSGLDARFDAEMSGYTPSYDSAAATTQVLIIQNFS